ncbi:hypothetical protein [Hymenobacter negativus]|uniref:CopG family transcriptional regulator n=1 Tax=Hymenobacter negativus TaxID=2795026 RepID=A0ABS3QI93_9BACT|nr:hypothetical protein [Hymenobacter negativus]MBO2010851.1 hypothetical protein [Hymenobacter negativus]
MLKVYCASKIEEDIRKLAAEQGVPYSHLLAPFLKAIADRTLVMVPHFPPPKPQPGKAA